MMKKTRESERIDSGSGMQKVGYGGGGRGDGGRYSRFQKSCRLSNLSDVHSQKKCLDKFMSALVYSQAD